MVGVHAPFLECAGLERALEPIAGGHDALFAAGIQLIFAAAGARFGAAFLEFSSRKCLDIAIKLGLGLKCD